MSWLRSSPLRSSFSRQGITGASSANTSSNRCDPQACYESFCKHWQQANDIIYRSQNTSIPTHDDVLGVVSHLEHLATLLLLEVRHLNGKNKTNEDTISTITSGDADFSTTSIHVDDQEEIGDFASGGQCLEHLLSENLLEKLYEWGSSTGRYMNAVRLEQMKLYSLLVTHSGQHLLAAEPFLRPLLKLLSSFRAELLPPDVEGRLVCLLGQLCVVLMQNSKFVDLFFYPALHSQDKQQSCFVPVTLLLSYVHREGPIGQQARAALLLCAALSAKNQAVAEFVAHRSNVCPVLATGLSGLYCLLPRYIDVSQPDWHRLTPDDVNDIDKLGLFMNSLEFCNAVAQVSHPLIQQQLLDFLYQGFLLPVMGPALLQTKRGAANSKRRQCLQNGVDEQVAAIAYFELALRSVTEPGLLKSLVRFLMDNNYDGRNILDSIVPLIDAEARLSVVTISLLETLVDLNCEDLMLELVLKYLIRGHHLMVSHRRKSLDCDLNCKATGMFLNLSPECCTTKPLVIHQASSTPSRRNSSVNVRKMSTTSAEYNMHSLTSIGEQSPVYPMHRNMQPFYAYGLHSNESLYGNYHAYLCEARRKIKVCKKACVTWSSKYDGPIYSEPSKPTTKHDKVILSVVKDFQIEHSNLVREVKPINNIDIDEGHNESTNNLISSSNKDEETSLPSIGESSGYDSFKYKSEDPHTTPEEDTLVHDDPSKDFAEDSFWKSIIITDFTTDPLVETAKRVENVDSSQINNIDIGPLLRIMLLKLTKMLDNDVYVNIRLTGLITRLAVYQLPLLRSFLLCPWIVLQPSVTSLYQILVSLKQKIDESVRNEGDIYRLIEEAQQFLIDREIRLTNARKNAIESIGVKNYAQSPDDGRGNVPLTSNFTYGTKYINSDTPGSSQPNSGTWDQQPSSIHSSSSTNEPFRRNEPKRKSLSSSFTSMFSRKLISGASGITALYDYIASGLTGAPVSNHIPQLEHSPVSRNNAESQAGYSSYTEDNLWQSSKLRRIILNAIVLDEWLRELGALTQEHVIASVTDIMNSRNGLNNNHSCEMDAKAQSEFL